MWKKRKEKKNQTYWMVNILVLPISPSGLKWTNGLAEVIFCLLRNLFNQSMWQFYAFLFCYEFQYFNNLKMLKEYIKLSWLLLEFCRLWFYLHHELLWLCTIVRYLDCFGYKLSYCMFSVFPFMGILK